MKNKFFWKGYFLSISSLFYFFLFIFSLLGNVSCKGKGGKNKFYEKDQTYSVSLSQAIAENIPDDLEVKGSFVPSEKLEVKSELEAKVLSVKGKEGDVISQNDLLANLDGEKTRLLLEKLKLEVKEAEARIEAGLPLSVSNENPPKSELSNPKQLAPNVPSSRQSVDQDSKQGGGLDHPPTETAPTDRKNGVSADPALRVEEATLARLKAEVALTEKKLESVNVTAGISGLLTKKEISSGSFVKTGDLLFQIVRIDPIFFIVYLPRQVVVNIQKGSRFEVYADDLPGQTLVGEVTTIAPEESGQNKGFEVKISISNIMLKLRGGMSGKIILPHFQTKKVVLIPEVAILDRNQKKYVYVVDQNHAESREVELGKKVGEKIEVIKGVKEGEFVVSRGHFVFRQEKELVKVE